MKNGEKLKNSYIQSRPGPHRYHIATRVDSKGIVREIMHRNKYCDIIELYYMLDEADEKIDALEERVAVGGGGEKLKRIQEILDE